MRTKVLMINSQVDFCKIFLELAYSQQKTSVIQLEATKNKSVTEDKYVSYSLFSCLWFWLFFSLLCPIKPGYYNTTLRAIGEDYHMLKSMQLCKSHY